MNKITELFGVLCDEKADMIQAVARQICPYSGKKCYKTRKSAPETSIGTCTVHYRANDIIICPNRLLENRQIFLDCLHLLTLHEPGNELFVIPEIPIPGGNVDYFLVSVRNGKIKDFVGIELQTMDTTGTVWPERQRLLSQYGFTVDPADIMNRKTFGINWKMTAKTILMQLHHKSETFENLNKHIVLVIQKPFFDYINREFAFSNIHGVRLGDPVHIHSYDFGISEQKKLKLTLHMRISADSNGIAESLGLRTSAKIGLEDLNALLERKLRDEYKLSIL